MGETDLRSGEVVSHGERGGSGAIVDVDLVEDVRQVVDHRLLADEESVGNLAIAFSGRDKLDDLDFTRTESSGTWWRIRWATAQGANTVLNPAKLGGVD